MKKLTVAGTGYVGLVAGVCFAEVGHDVTCVDVDAEKIAMLNRGESPIYESGLTEMLKRNLAAGRLRFTTDCRAAYAAAADLSYIAAVAREIAESVVHDCLVVVKSTVPVGTNDKVEQFIKDFLTANVKVEVASNPEFLAQGTAVHDTMQASRIIIGTESKEAEALLMELYEPFRLPIVSVSRRSAEMIKYASNDFLALKISYMNDIANLCELVGANIEDVARGMRYDPRIGEKHLNAGVGYGGSCFPKDTKALRYLAEEHGYRLRTVDAAVEVNEEQRVKLFEKAKKRLITFRGLKIAILGLTFKAGTDDLREAASLYNVPLLLEQGAALTCYDPVGAEKFRQRYPALSYASSAEEALRGANVCFMLGRTPVLSSRSGRRSVRSRRRRSGQTCARRSSTTDATCSARRPCTKRAWNTTRSAGRKAARRGISRATGRENMERNANLFGARVLVTGAAGFIGFHLTKRLLAEGCCVTGFDNLNDYYDPALKTARLKALPETERFSFVRGDLWGTAARTALRSNGCFRTLRRSMSSILPRRRACATASTIRSSMYSRTSWALRTFSRHAADTP